MVVSTPLTGEPLAIDLVNTRPNTVKGPVDLLADVTWLRSWLGLQAERFPEPTPDAATLTETDLAALHAVREHIAAAVHATRHGERPPATALDGLNAALQAAPAIQELVWDGSSVRLTTHRPGAPGARLAALFAEDVVGLLTDPAVRKVRLCEGEDCVMLFVQTHPRRRWCSASRCGNRARVANYYQRHKAN